MHHLPCKNNLLGTDIKVENRTGIIKFTDDFYIAFQQCESKWSLFREPLVTASEL